MLSGLGMDEPMKIELVTFCGGEEPTDWSLGPVSPLEYTSASIHQHIKSMADSDVDAVLFWDLNLGVPDSGLMENLLSQPYDLWHAGLSLGTAGMPLTLDSLSPSWMLNRDLEAGVEGSSWRVSFRACLVRINVLKSFRAPSAEFASVLGAGLEWGYRLICRGVFTRYVPEMIPHAAQGDARPVTTGEIGGNGRKLSVQDELRFARLSRPTVWYLWVAFRGFLSGRLSRLQVLTNFWGVLAVSRPPTDPAFRPLGVGRTPTTTRKDDAGNPRVTVLLPTINRYPYLLPLIEQVGAQTIPPHQIIVIDQSASEERQRDIASRFPNLPILYLEQDSPGQCSSRNKGLLQATGDFILFLDDDDEIQPNLIELHWEAFRRYGCDASCGVADEAGVAPLSEAASFVRVSDVFPTNNCMVKRERLTHSGLFDLAYDRGKRADGDLGMRVRISGAHMVLDPTISVFHHRAPMGGLRTHGQRVVTRASSRAQIAHMNLSTEFDIYLSRRYFTEAHTKELMWISGLGSLRLHGSFGLQILKLLFGILVMPRTIWRLMSAYEKAGKRLEEYPQIESLPTS